MGASMTDPLHVGIIGCGIAGLSAAIALSRAGHDIEIFEKSQFKNEVGAAIIFGPNGMRILERWGFDAEAAGAVDFMQMRRFRADTLDFDSGEKFENVVKTYGHRWGSFHRADLHNQLRILVEKQNPQPKINLASPVSHIDPDSGTITFTTNGQTTTIQKDLLIIADGAHSPHIPSIIGHDIPVSKSPMSMYRFLQPFSQILNNPITAPFYRDVPPGFTTFYRTPVGRPGLLLNTFPCRSSTLLYCALIHPTKPSERHLHSWDSPASTTDLLYDAAQFHPSVQAICAGATDVKVYTQMWRDPLPHFTRGRAVLIGDAGHLMLPTHGQGACMAIEDAAALEVLFRGVRVSRPAASPPPTPQPLSSSSSSPGPVSSSASTHDDGFGSSTGSYKNDNNTNDNESSCSYKYSHFYYDTNNTNNTNSVNSFNSGNNTKSSNSNNSTISTNTTNTIDQDNDVVSQRLRLFDTLRLPRVRATQTLSNKMMGPPAKMEAEVRRYYDGPLPEQGAKTFSKGYNDFFFEYNVRNEAKRVLWGLSDEV